MFISVQNFMQLSLTSTLSTLNFAKVTDNRIKFDNFAQIWTYNRREKFCSKFLSRWENIAIKHWGWYNFLTHTVGLSFNGAFSTNYVILHLLNSKFFPTSYST